jgi:hypothetical protein
MDKLQQTVEREMELLRDLPAAAPRAECVERVRSAVMQQARRAARIRRWISLGRAAAGAAAALILAVGWLTLPIGVHSIGPDPGEVLDEWAAALEASSQRLAGLVGEAWAQGEARVGDDEGNLEELLDSLDRSFERFEAL